MLAGYKLADWVSVADAFPGLDRTIRDVLHAYDVPGAAVAAVSAGRRVLSTYGERRRGGRAPVTPTTAFNVASTSKAFAAAACARLVHSGALDWDAPVRRYVPEFCAWDPWVAAHTTLRDLSGNRTGLPRTGVCEFGTELSIDAEEVVRRLVHVEPAAEFRSRFTYSNVGHTVVAMAVERASGMPYARALEQLVLSPLGMRSSAAGRAAEALPDIAGWHCAIDGRTVEIDPIYTDVHRGSAGVCVSGYDALAWLEFLLGDGCVGPTPLLSASGLAELFEPQVVVRPEQLAIWIGPPEARFAAYALGWGVAEQGGRRIVRHSGSDFGINAHVALAREEGVGVAVYVNKDCKASIDISYRVMDVLLGNPPRDWSAVVQDRSLPDTNASFRHSARTPPAARPAPAEAAAYVGEYLHPVNGPTRVDVAADGTLAIEFSDAPVFNAELRPLGDGTFLTIPRYAALGSDTVGGRFEARFGGERRATSLAIAGIGTFCRSGD